MVLLLLFEGALESLTLRVEVLPERHLGTTSCRLEWNIASSNQVRKGVCQHLGLAASLATGSIAGVNQLARARLSCRLSLRSMRRVGPRLSTSCLLVIQLALSCARPVVVLAWLLALTLGWLADLVCGFS